MNAHFRSILKTFRSKVFTGYNWNKSGLRYLCMTFSIKNYRRSLLFCDGYNVFYHKIYSGPWCKSSAAVASLVIALPAFRINNDKNKVLKLCKNFKTRFHSTSIYTKRCLRKRATIPWQIEIKPLCSAKVKLVRKFSTVLVDVAWRRLCWLHGTIKNSTSPICRNELLKARFVVLTPDQEWATFSTDMCNVKMFLPTVCDLAVLN